MTDLDVLKAAKDLITPKGAWLTNGETSRDIHGNFCSCKSPKAVSFCAMMAINRIADQHRLYDDNNLYRLMDEACGMRFDRFNDTHTQAEVLAAFDRAIAKAEGK